MTDKDLGHASNSGSPSQNPSTAADFEPIASQGDRPAMTDERIAEIRQAATEIAPETSALGWLPEITELLAEVDRLRAQLKEYEGWSPHQFEGVLKQHKELGEKYIVLDRKWHDLQAQLAAADLHIKDLQIRVNFGNGGRASD
jgi:hypothetical protein